MPPPAPRRPAAVRLPRVLAACAPASRGFISEALRRGFRLKAVTRFREAVEALESGEFDLLLCGVHFDESRMFDVLRHGETARPALPRVCCRVLESEVPVVFLDALRVAVESSGASLIDVPRLSAKLGPEAAMRRFRVELRRRLASRPRPGRAS